MWRFYGLVFVLTLTGSTTAAAKYPVPKGAVSVTAFPSPDGKWVMLQGDYRARDSGGGDTSDLWLMRTGTKKLKRFTRNKHSAQPAWSPDSRQIAYIRNTDLWIANLSGTRHKRLAEGEGTAQHCRSLQYEEPKWSADGRYLAVVGASGTSWISVYCVGSGMAAYQSGVETHGHRWLKSGDFSFEDYDGRYVVKAAILQRICARKLGAGHPTHEAVRSPDDDTNAQSVALRSAPSTHRSSAILSRLTFGTHVSVLKSKMGPKNKWLKVRVESGPHKGRAGFVSSDWVRVRQEKLRR
jgi:hypothetical protein